MMGDKGIIFNIQRFSIHDGPGIRTTVFLKGCPLQCAWCANPESQSPNPQLLVRNIKCRSCGKCVSACPRGALTWSRNTGRQIHWERCNQCLHCVEACSFQSLNISGYEASIDTVLTEVEKDGVFYKNSGGGVTLSGGEPLFQKDFVVSLAKRIKEKGLHVALDTCGFVPAGHYDAILPYIDLILYDIKILDPQMHKRYSGSDNRLILDNAHRLAGLTKMWFRIPVIAGFNDSDDQIRETARIAKNIGVKKISLLPYHEGGKSKCEQIGVVYKFSEGLIPEDSRMQHLANIIRELGVDTSIGY